MSATTPTFVTTIPLRASPAQAAALNKRFEAARQVYNACLGESRRRLNLMRQAKEWAAARKLPKGKARTQAFRALNKQFKFENYKLQSFAQQFGHEWLGHHLDSQTVKQLSARAFTWVEQSLFDRGRGAPRFKRYGSLNSVESINNTQGIIWRDEQVIWNAGRHGKTLVLEAIIDLDDPVMNHGLESRIKYVRLVRRDLNGRRRFYAQLVNEGLPYQRFPLGEGVVGLDIGPSTVAIVGPDSAHLLRLAAELKDRGTEIRRLQRQLERQRRANNPANYEPDYWEYPKGQKPRRRQGQVKKGPHTWVRSKKQTKNEVRLSELHRKQAEHRKSLHGHLINQILQMCDTVRIQKLSYAAFQRLYGQAVGMRAPGAFIARLRGKMGQAGGLFEEFEGYEVKPAQRCHGCGRLAKKPLSQRWHRCECGIVAQRDLYAAFLAACVEDGEFKASLANDQWPGLGPVLQAAIKDLQTGDRWPLPTSFGITRSRSQSSGTAA